MTELLNEEAELLHDTAAAVAQLKDQLAEVLGSPGPEPGDVVSQGMPRVPTGRRRRRKRGRPSAALRRARNGEGGRSEWSRWMLTAQSPTGQAASLQRLRRFVDWINHRFELPLTTWAVPSCWYRHSGVVEDLWALLAAHEAAFRVTIPGEDAATDGPASWIERWLWPTLKRLRSEHGLRECVTTGKHASLFNTPIRTDDEFGAFVEKLATCENFEYQRRTTAP